MERYQCGTGDCLENATHFCNCQKASVCLCTRHANEHLERLGNHSVFAIWQELDDGERKLILELHRCLEKAANSLTAVLEEEYYSVSKLLLVTLNKGWNKYEGVLQPGIDVSEWITTSLRSPELEMGFVTELGRAESRKLCKQADQCSKEAHSDLAISWYRGAIQVQKDYGLFQDFAKTLPQLIEAIENIRTCEDTVRELVAYIDMFPCAKTEVIYTLKSVQTHGVRLSEVVKLLSCPENPLQLYQVYAKIVEHIQHYGVRKESETLGRHLSSQEQAALRNQYKSWASTLALQALDDPVVDLEKQFSQSFTSNEIRQLKYGCPVTVDGLTDESSITCRFLSESIRDYMIAKEIVRHLDTTVLGNLRPTDPINLCDLASQQRICSFSVQMINHKQKHYEDLLVNIVKQTRKRFDITQASANAITLLNQLNFCFAFKDFSRVKIAGADLFGANLNGVDFAQSDLSGVNFTLCKLINTNLKLACLKSVTFGATQLLPTYSTSVTKMSFSSDGTLAVWEAHRNTVAVWSTEQPVRYFTGHSDWVRDLCISADFKLIVSSSADTTVIIWDAVTGEPLQILKSCEEVPAVCISPDNVFVASGSLLGTITMWCVLNGQPVRTLDGHSHAISAVSFSLDRTVIISGSEDYDIIFWETATGEQIRTLNGHRSCIHSFSFSSNNELVASSGGRSVILWELASGRQVRTLQDQSAPVTVACFLPDNTAIASGNNCGTVMVWEVISGQLLYALQHSSSSIRAICFTFDNRFVAVCALYREITIWATGIQARVDCKRSCREQVTSLCIAPGGDLFAFGYSNGAITVWKTANGEYTYRLQGHSLQVTSVSFSVNSAFLVSSSSDMTMILWEVATERPLRMFKSHSANVSAICLSPDRSLLAAGDQNGCVIILETATGNEVLSEQQACKVDAMHFSPEKVLTICGVTGQRIIVWEAGNIDSLWESKASRRVTSACISFDGALLALGEARSGITIKHTKSAHEICTLNYENCLVTAICFSSSCLHIAAADGYQTINVWDLHSGQLVYTLQGSPREVIALSFSSDDRLVVAGDLNCNVVTWNIKVD